MTKRNSAAIFIPVRMASARLPGKPLASINGKPMVLHVVERAKESLVGDIYIACAEQEIADAVELSGGHAILTDPSHPSGTDRIYEAYKKTGKQYDYIINLQGDLPIVNPGIISKALDVIEKHKDADIVTLASVIKLEEERTNPNVVKAVVSQREDKIGKALYFTRATAPYGEGDLLHHIGIYVYRTSILEKFVQLSPSVLEQREKLEQLRALENDMNIYVLTVDAVPFGVDTQEDLEKVRKIIGSK